MDTTIQPSKWVDLIVIISLLWYTLDIIINILYEILIFFSSAKKNQIGFLKRDKKKE